MRALPQQMVAVTAKMILEAELLLSGKRECLLQQFHCPRRRKRSEKTVEISILVIKFECHVEFLNL